MRFSTLEIQTDSNILIQIQKMLLRFNSEVVSMLKKSEKMESIGTRENKHFRDS